SGPDPLHRALHAAWRPCTLATLTTVIGLMSLTGSDIQPVADFGRAAAIGSLVAMLVGLGLVPAAIIVCPPPAGGPEHSRSTWPLRSACWIVNSGRAFTLACL